MSGYFEEPADYEELVYRINSPRPYTISDLRLDLNDLKDALDKVEIAPEDSHDDIMNKHLRMACLGYFKVIITTCGNFMQDILAERGYTDRELLPDERTYLGYFGKAAELKLIPGAFPMQWKQCYYTRNEAAHEYSQATLENILGKCHEILPLAESLLPLFEELEV